MALKLPSDGLIILPKEILSQIKNASAEELKVLIYSFSDGDADIATVARECGITVAKAESAFAFWRGAGIFSEATAPKKKVATDTSVYRNYDSAEIANAITEKSDFALICHVASEKLGKILTKNDHSSLLYLYDFVGIPASVICGVIEDCCTYEKKSLQYIFKKALGLYDDGIDSYEKFEKYLEKKKAINSNIGKLRKLCGMGDRALTSNEQKAFDRWFGEWAMPYETVELAYEKTVDNTGKFSVTYMNSILRRWHENGFVTVEDIKNGEASRSSGVTSSFEGDEFIEAALKRGFDGGKDLK